MRLNAVCALFLASFLLSGTVAWADTSITAAGSTALLPLVKEAAVLYQQRNPEIKISVNGGGSGQGITQVAAKAVDIGDSDIIARNQPALVDHKVAVVGFSVVARSGVGVKNLTKTQIKDIFLGKTTNWKEVGGADLKITVVNRPRSSGTRAVFVQTLMQGTPVNEGIGVAQDATGTVISVVKQTPGAVSYAAFSGTHNQAGIEEIAIDGIAPLEANVISGKYPFWSYEHMYTNGLPNKDVSRFLAFLMTRRELLRKLGYIPITEMKVTETDR